MKKTRFTDEQMVTILREADRRPFLRDTLPIASRFEMGRIQRIRPPQPRTLPRHAPPRRPLLLGQPLLRGPAQRLIARVRRRQGPLPMISL